MRVIKANTLRYVPFQKSLPSLSRHSSGKNNSRDLNQPGDEMQYSSDRKVSSNSGREILDELVDFISLLNSSETVTKVNQTLYSVIKNHFDFIEADFFFFDTNNTMLVSPDNSATPEANNFINNAYKEGILEWAFGSKLPRSIPLYNVYPVTGEGGQYLIIPLFEGSSPKGIFSILHNAAFDNDNASISYLQVTVGYAFQRISLLMRNEEAKVAYNSLQAYQSKMSNDFRLSAVGELAGGVLEEILDPLQVIYSSVDLLHNYNGNAEIVASIKKQVRKIESSAGRLIKFAERNDYNKIKVIPCDLNKIIENYYAIVSSSLEKKQVECILALEPGLPSILTHPDLINQLLVNVFSIITADIASSNGIIIQTQLVKDIVKLTFITAGTVQSLIEDSTAADPNLKIISQLVQKHEGTLFTASNWDSGSKIEIKFPLKRKIRS